MLYNVTAMEQYQQGDYTVKETAVQVVMPLYPGRSLIANSLSNYYSFIVKRNIRSKCQSNKAEAIRNLVCSSAGRLFAQLPPATSRSSDEQGQKVLRKAMVTCFFFSACFRMVWRLPNKTRSSSGIIASFEQQVKGKVPKCHDFFVKTACIL